MITREITLRIAVADDDQERRRHLTGIERDGHRKRALIALLNRTSTEDETLSIEVERDDN